MHLRVYINDELTDYKRSAMWSAQCIKQSFENRFAFQAMWSLIDKMQKRYERLQAKKNLTRFLSNLSKNTNFDKTTFEIVLAYNQKK